MRGVRFRVLDASLAATPLERGPGQVIPAARRAACSAFLMASPRLMEPLLAVEALLPAGAAPTLQRVLRRRRGRVVSEAQRPGTPFVVARGYLPAMDSLGMEVDLRALTRGGGMVTSRFARWEEVTGDPLDASVELKPLEPSPPHALAREFTVKTRRRKGLSEEVSVQRFFDEEMLAELAGVEAGDEG